MADESMMECPECGGEGMVDDEVCASCDGEGMVSKKKMAEMKCPDCDGEGMVDGKKCPKCDGKGMMQMGEQTGALLAALKSLIEQTVKTHDQEMAEEDMEMSEKGTVPYFKRLHALLKERVQGFVSESEFMEMTKKARGHAGAMGRMKKRQEAMMGEGEGYRLFIELNKYAEPPEWIPFLPKPGEFNHPEYGKIKITKQRNQNFIDNFTAAVYQSKLPINAEHKPNEEGAYGWITGMRLNSDNSVDAKVDWTDLGDKAIRNDRFKYISPEFFDTWERKTTGEKIKDVASGAALTVRPFFKEESLRALVANEHGIYAVSDHAPAHYTRVLNDRDSKLYFTALEPVKEGKSMAEKEPAKAGMNEDEAKRFGEFEKQFADYKAATDAQIKTLTETVTAKDGELKTANEKITAMEKSARRDRFTAIAKGFNGKTEDHVKFMEFVADNDPKGEESEQLKAYVERERATAEQLKAANLFSEIGSDATGGGVSALDRMNAEAKKMCEGDKTLTHEQAFAKVMEQQPKLYNEYLAERRVS